MVQTPRRLTYAPDTIGTLRSFLRGLDGFSTVIHELLQNAEDARATRFVVEFTPDALLVGNDQVFEEANFEALLRFAAGSKRHDVEQIGSFGIGFISVYQLTDQPEVMSRGQSYTLLPLDGVPDVQDGVEHPWATTIRLPWAFAPSKVREGLESDPIRPEQLPGFVTDACAALRTSAVFLNHVQHLQVVDRGRVIEEIHVDVQGDRRVIRTLQAEIGYRIHRVTVKDPAVQGVIDRRERRGRLRLAVPERLPDDFQGLFFAALPTQERTFLPFHLDADFYPNPDRKSLLWDGNDSSKQRWNAAVLEAAQTALPEVLSQLKEAGVASLYPFSHACLKAPSVAGQVRAAPWITQCAGTIRAAFYDHSYLSSEQCGWVKHDRFIISDRKVALPSDLRRRIEARSQWAFTDEASEERYASFFAALKIRTLDAERFIKVLPQIFTATDRMNVGTAAWDVVSPALVYLRDTLTHHPQQTDLLTAHAKTIQAVPFAVDRAGRLGALESLHGVEAQWANLSQTWLMDDAVLNKLWMDEAGPALARLVDVLTPDRLLAILGKRDVQELLTPLEDRSVRERLYAFLGDQFSPKSARALPLCRDSDGRLHPAERMVLPGEVKDPFGLFVEVHSEDAKAFASFFFRLGVRALDAEAYYMQALPELIQTQPDQREAVLRHLASTPFLIAERLTFWRSQRVIRTQQGPWVAPQDAYFAHPLLEQLFETDYQAVADDLESDTAIQRLLRRLGTISTPTPQDLARIVRERAGQPITEKTLPLCRALLNHALSESAVLEEFSNQKLAWLPDETRSHWHAPDALWASQRRILVGHHREPHRAFVGLEINDEQAGKLGLAEPKVDTVLLHLQELYDRRKPLPQEALAWLETQNLTEAEIIRLRELPLFAVESDQFKSATFFFTKTHKFAPFRGLLHENYVKKYPKLIKNMRILDNPDPQAYALILGDIARTIGDNGRTTLETAELITMCLVGCGQGFKRGEPDPSWLASLRNQRIIPVGSKEEPTIKRPTDALLLDLPEERLKQYGLDDLRPILTLPGGSQSFLRALGVRSLRQVMKFTIVSSVTQGTPSAYNTRLRELRPALLRYLCAERKTEDVGKLKKELSGWQFQTVPSIEAEISFPSFPARNRRVLLDHQVDPKQGTLFHTQSISDFVPGQLLREALRLDKNELVSLMTYSLEQAQEYLDSLDIPPLPEVAEPYTRLEEAVAHPPSDLPNPISPPKETPSSALDQTTGGQTGDTASKPTEPPVSRSASSSDTTPKLRSRPTVPPKLPHPTGSNGANPASLPPVASEADEVRARMQRSAVNASRRKESQDGDKPKSRRPTTRAEGSRPRRAGMQFRNYVHVTADGAESDTNPSPHNRAVDAIGMRVVMQYERLNGRTPADHSDQPDGGYDILSEGPEGTRLIEVKTISGAWDGRGVTLSRKQMSTAFKKENRFWLYVVECAFSNPQLWCLQNPAWVATSYTFADDWATERLADGPFSVE